MPNWYDIRNQTADSAEILLYDEIGGWGVSAAEFARDLRGLSGKAVTLRIHSPGGSVLDGHAIYNALARHDGGVTVQIDGLAASMASVIAMAGAPVKMAENAFLMIHNPSGIAMGESEDMRKAADLIDKMKDGLVNIYAKKTGKPANEIEAMMDAETWFTANEAKEFGLVDEVTGRIEIAAKFSAVTKFKHTPTALVDNATTTNMASIENITAERDTALASLTAAQAQAQTNFSALAAANERNTALAATLTERDCELVTIKASFDELSAKLADAEAKAAPEVINAEVTRLLSASGHPPIALGTGSASANQPTTTKTQQFLAIENKDERFAFYQKHKTEILGGK